MAVTIGVAGGGTFVYLRYWRGNFHEVVPGKVYRSAQPSPERLREWIEEYNIRTVINLRGESSKAFMDAERRITRQMGVELINIRFSALDLPSRRWLGVLVEALESAPAPILLHCRDGADRTGVASVLAAMAVGNERLDSARDHLSWKYLHFDESPQHIAGLIQGFEKWIDQQDDRPGNWEDFRHWAREVYRPRYYYVRFDLPETLTLAPGEHHDIDLTFTNLSGETIPLSDPDRLFCVRAFLGTSIEDRPGRRVGPRPQLPRNDLDHGESMTLRYTIRAPREPGVYDVRTDLVEEHVTWFARQGSPMGRMRLVVTEPQEACTVESTPLQGDPTP